MSNKDFVHLHCHTHYSIQDALPTPEKLILGAKERGFSAIAITDHGKMGGHFELVEAGKKHGVKPILGCEFYLAKDRFIKHKEREKLCHLTVIAQNETGYINLLKLGNEASKPECYYYKPRIDFEFLAQHREGLIVLSGCLASELNQALLNEGYETALKVAKRYKDVFGENYFIELQYHGIEDQKKTLPSLIKIATELNIKTVASNDVHYMHNEDWKLHDTLLQMRNLREDKGKKVAKHRDAYGTHQFWLKSYEEMEKIFGAKAPEALSNTLLISEMVEDFYQIDRPHLLPEGKIDYEDEKFVSFKKSKMPQNSDKEAFLAYHALKGLRELGLADNPEYLKRLKYEIETIWYMGVVDYFLNQKEMVDFMKENDIYYGIRGSGVGSLLNYCLGISSIDPVKFNLMFERFLNPGRGNQYKIDLEDFSGNKDFDLEESLNIIKTKCKEFLKTGDNNKYQTRISKEVWILENQGFINKVREACEVGFKLKNNNSNFIVFHVLGLIDTMPSGDLIVQKVSSLPDIDTDIDDSRRQEVIDWAKQRFGEENVKAVGTWGTYKAKAAMLGTLKTSDKFLKQYPQNSAQQAIKITSTIPGRIGTTIESALRESEDFKYWSKKFPEETNNASRLYGVISNLGVHAAAVVISSKPIQEIVPIENSKGTFCTSFDMKNVERTGIVKYDYLGLSTLRQINLAVKMIKERHGISLNYVKLPLDDADVLKEIFSKGHTVGVFQFSGEGMQSSLKEVKVSSVEDLIAVAALYRPGPKKYIPSYAKGKFNPGSVKYAHPLIEKHLSETYGVMVYQEQAMFLSREMAQLGWLDVDKLRKAISKKTSTQFKEACLNLSTKSLARNIPKKAVDEVLELMSEFGEYAFNKSHSCMYAIMGYWTGWLKYYYPSEWLAACIETAGDEEDLDMFLKECERMNIKVSDPSVNISGMHTTVAPDGTIYLPLTSLKGVGDSAEQISTNKPYNDLYDFIEKSKCNKSLFVALAAGGALNCLVPGDVDDEYFVDFWIEHSKNKKVKSSKNIVNNNGVTFLNVKDLSVKEQKTTSNSLLNDLDEL